MIDFSLSNGRKRFCRSIVALCVIGVISPALAAREKPTPGLDDAWRDAAGFLIDEANRIFAETKASSEDQEIERTLGEALTLLNIQPRTASNLERAEGMLKKMAAKEGRAGVFARYFLARIYEMYSEPPRTDEARAMYQELLRSGGDDPMAERAASALVLMEIYENVSPGERARRFEALETMAGTLKSPSGLRAYHLNMGNGYLYFPKMEGSARKAFDHLMAADRIGITRWQVESMTWIAIGQLAERLGEKELAITYYQRFLDRYQRDNRHYSISKALEALREQ